MTTLVLKHLRFERNNRPLFHGLNYSLSRGELLHIRGANGSGKSTLLRIIASYIEPQQGDILWENQSIFSFSDYSQQLHYLGHQNGIKPYLTVLENLHLYCALMQKSSDIHTVLKKMDLFSIRHHQALRLSAGQLRRLALARLLLKTAPLWVLDEPTTALDSAGQQLFSELLQQHLSQGGLAVLSSHHDLPLANIQYLQLGEQHV